MSNKYWDENKDWINKNRLKQKIKKYCKYCDKSFESARKNQLFCRPKHKEKQHYIDRTFNEKSRAKAILKIHDKKKVRIGGFEYTEPELKTIERMYKRGKNGIEIAEKLDRPIQGVRWKIREMKRNNIIIEKGML